MEYPVEVAAAVAKAAAAAKTPPRAAAEAAAQFQYELQSALQTSGGGDGGGIRPADVLSRLAEVFPGATITSASLGSFGAVKDHYAASATATSVNLDAATISRMGTDAGFARSVEEALSSLLSAGKDQPLVAAGGSAGAGSRHVSVSGETIRYTEVQRTASGTQMAVTSLSIAGEAGGGGGGADLDNILAELAAGGSGGGSGSSSSGGAPFDFLLRGSSTTATYRGGDGRSPSSAEYAYSFSSANWRLESFLSPTAARNVMATRGQFQWQQVTRQITLQGTTPARQWPASGSGSGSGTWGKTVDFQSYMELMGLTDPLVLDLAGDGINLKSAEDGVYFDIRADGRPVKTAFVQGDDAFLYLDENGNGTADSGAELFGDHGGFANGFDKLARHDENADGVIDVHDAVYSKLRLWRDRNGDGVNQTGESVGLADAGVASISLAHGSDGRLDPFGNVISDVGSFVRADGRAGRVADAWLRQLG